MSRNSRQREKCTSLRPRPVTATVTKPSWMRPEAIVGPRSRSLESLGSTASLTSVLDHDSCESFREILNEEEDSTSSYMERWNMNDGFSSSDGVETSIVSVEEIGKVRISGEGSEMKDDVDDDEEEWDGKEEEEGEVEDIELDEDAVLELLEKIVKKCTAPNPMRRPLARDILRMLREGLPEELVQQLST